MLCNKIIQPEFTREQIAECQTCKWISGKKKWCGHFGVQVIEKGKILVPSKKIRHPISMSKGRRFNRRNNKVVIPTYILSAFERDFEIASSNYRGSGEVVVGKKEYLKRRYKCDTCLDKVKCPMRACSRWRQVILKKARCPLGKW